MKRLISLLLALVMLLSLTACGSEPASTEPTTPPVQMSDTFREAVEQGIAWEELASEPDSPIVGADLVKLIANALTVLSIADSPVEFNKFAEMYGNLETVERHHLAQLLYAASQDVWAGHAFTLNATGIHYEVGGAYKPFGIWDCPDSGAVDNLGASEACNFAISAFDRLTGDKLMEPYEDWTFRPEEPVSVESAVESVFRFSRSFEKYPVYTDVTDAKASVCTIDPALYTGQTSLPDATNQDLPEWKGCNISYNSMFAGGLCFNPDDCFVESNLDYIKELGMNFVHIYLSWSYFQGPDHTFDSKVNLSRLAQLDEIISWCMERDIHIQLVFNDVPNLDWNNLGQDPAWLDSWNSCFTDAAVKDSVTAFWRMLAKRYADIPNNYLSFNLMNECDPADDAQYVWALEDAVRAVWEESPGRVIVADVSTTSPDVKGETMAALGCALSYHYYNLRDISVISAEKEASAPGFYESIDGISCLANASFYGPTYWDTSLPEAAKGAMKVTGDVGGATLSVTVQDLSWFDTVMRLSAGGQTLYEGMEPYTYDEETDYIAVNATVTVTLPKDATSFEIECSEGSCFTLSDMSLTLADGTEIPFLLVFDYWQGVHLAEITVSKDGSFTSTLTLADLKQNGQSLAELIAVGEKYGVDVMVGELGFFEGGEPMAAGIRQEVTEELLRQQIGTFESLGLAWCCEYIGRYSPVTPAPYLAGIEYRDLENSPYYINLEMDEFFREILAE